MAERTPEFIIGLIGGIIGILAAPGLFIFGALTAEIGGGAAVFGAALVGGILSVIGLAGASVCQESTKDLRSNHARLWIARSLCCTRTMDGSLALHCGWNCSLNSKGETADSPTPIKSAGSLLHYVREAHDVHRAIQQMVLQQLPEISLNSERDFMPYGIASDNCLWSRK